MTEQEKEKRLQELREEWKLKLWKREIILRQVKALELAYAKNSSL